MTGLDYFAWIVFIVIVVSVVVVFIVLAQLPGKTAAANGHPQADAINVASWLGLLFTGGIVWILAMVWSRMRPVAEPVQSDRAEVDALKSRIADLESQLARSGGDAA
jgi:hypothetical protein